MFPNPIPSSPRLHRRAALGAAGAAAAALGLGGRVGQGAAQAAIPSALACATAAGQTAAINGVELYYEVNGPTDGQPVLLLHGGAGNMEWWVNVAPVLVAAGYRVAAMDSRRHGRSGWGK